MEDAERPGEVAAALAALATLLLCPSAHCADYAVGEGKLTVGASLYAGTAIRTDDQDARLLADVNSSLVSIDGRAVTPSSGRNGDDGNLNFNRGDALSTVVKGYLTLGYSWQNYGAALSGKAWYDRATAHDSHPWGNIPSGFAANKPLSDEGAIARSRFSGIVADNLYAYGSNRFDAVKLDWTAGYQKLDWGNRYVAAGGLGDLNPLDAPATLRPGVQREQVRLAGVRLWNLARPGYGHLLRVLSGPQAA